MRPSAGPSTTTRRDTRAFFRIMPRDRLAVGSLTIRRTAQLPCIASQSLGRLRIAEQKSFHSRKALLLPHSFLNRCNPVGLINVRRTPSASQFESGADAVRADGWIVVGALAAVLWALVNKLQKEASAVEQQQTDARRAQKRQAAFPGQQREHLPAAGPPTSAQASHPSANAQAWPDPGSSAARPQHRSSGTAQRRTTGAPRSPDPLQAQSPHDLSKQQPGCAFSQPSNSIDTWH